MRAGGTLRTDGEVDLRIVASLGRGDAFRKIPILKETMQSLKGFVSWTQSRGLSVYRVTGTLREPKVESVKLFGLLRKDVETYHQILKAPEEKKP